MPELRKDPVVGRWVIISTERGRTTLDFGENRRDEARRASARSARATRARRRPRCSPTARSLRARTAPGWTLRVVPNKFPALQIEGSLNRRGEGLYDKMNGHRRHEVIIEGPEHHVDFADMSEEHIASVLWAYRSA
jgi:UDPglucose--hexose-1-phosphate uridylyltransferase